MNQKKVNKSVSKIKPMFNKILVTANEIKVGNIILVSGDDKGLDEVQTIVSTGPHAAEGLKPNVKVKLDFVAYTKLKNKDYHDKIEEKYILMIPTVETPEGKFLLMNDRDVEYIIED